MKNLLAALLMAIMAFLPVSAETDTDITTEVYTVEGVITQVGEAGEFLIDDRDTGLVQVNTHAETVWNGVETPTVGDYVHVVYDGAMTRSLPPQITADAVSCYRIEGEVTAFDLDAGTMMLDTAESGEVLVRLPEDPAVECQPGDRVTVYFNGAMTLSIPAQINADCIVLVNE